MLDGSSPSISPSNWNSIVQVLKRRGPKVLFAKFIAHGWLGVITAGSALASDYYTIDASIAQKKAATAEEKFYTSLESSLPDWLNSIKGLDIQPPETAFNSGFEFNDAFLCAMLLNIALAVRRGANALESIAASLNGIHEELKIQTSAQVNGWSDEGFGYYAYETVARIMRYNPNGDCEQAFYLCVPDNTGWKIKFEAQNRLNPLDPRFGGHNHDLALLCTRMWTDRQTLLNTTPKCKSIRLHLILLSFDTVHLPSPITFHESLLPLEIHGELYRGSPKVFLNIKRNENIRLEHIGIHQENEEVMEERAGEAVSGFAKSTVFLGAGLLATVLFPPLAIYEGVLAAGFVTSHCVTMTTIFGTIALAKYHEATREAPRVLGPPYDDDEPGVEENDEMQ